MNRAVGVLRSGVLAIGWLCFVHVLFVRAMPLSAGQVLPLEMADRVAAELSTRQFDASAADARNPRDVFRNIAPSVPLIIAKEGSGSGALIRRRGPSGLIVTNYHVATPAFVDKDGAPFVVAVFYDPRLARDFLDRPRVIRCLTGRDPTPWCGVLNEATHFANVLSVDGDRDLAILRVENLPEGIQAIPSARSDAISPGDSVIVIGHPLGFLWTVTSGIVGGVRSQYPVSDRTTGIFVTVIQTQSPVNPGNSGGPLLTSSGQLMGIIFASTQRPVNTGAGGPEIAVNAQGLNLAISVDEVDKFVARHPGR